MKRILVPLVCSVFLIACTQSEDIETEEQSVENEVEPVKTLTASQDDIRFVVGWLNETAILFVAHTDTEDRLLSYDLQTGDIHTIFTTSSTISEVQVHPTAEQLLVKTADDPTEAILHILDHAGTPLNEVSVASSELEIQWNGIDASQILITAFSDDWSYEIMRYDANNDTLVAVELPDPFPHWLGTEELVYIEDANVWKQSLSTGEKTTLANNTNQFHSATDRVLIESFEGEQVRYAVLNSTGEEKNSWLAEDDAFVMDRAVLLNENTWMMTVTNQTEMMPTSFLVKIEDGEEVKRQELPEGGTLDCEGNKCLTGYSLDTWIDIETGETVKWLEIGRVE
ncbi:hypothetical protein CSV74_03310 [Sporosarcina sp. P19]|uniref:YqgU-like beta propeller domain-containing protein n=1 Tax=Sporosarcina sp. P19 TaxID=2048258 RepID=UPI000C16E536|nr:hypothetical protein [Sporosarcina sp. P19]PIC78564.1 hypothetical protein CSV74_03310 [Sporosarcina sp. P19]